MCSCVRRMPCRSVRCVFDAVCDVELCVLRPVLPCRVCRAPHIPPSREPVWSHVFSFPCTIVYAYLSRIYMSTGYRSRVAVGTRFNDPSASRIRLASRHDTSPQSASRDSIIAVFYTGARSAPPHARARSLELLLNVCDVIGEDLELRHQLHLARRLRGRRGHCGGARRK